MAQTICPECGEPMAAGSRVCENCHYELTDAEYNAMHPTATVASPASAPVPSGATAPPTTKPTMPAGAPEAVMAHGNVDVSQHHTEDKSTHNVDQSQTINNTQQTVTNTFIIMGGGATMPNNLDPQTAAALQQAQQHAPQAATQPAPQQNPTPSAQPTTAANGQKGIGAIDSSAVPIQPTSRNAKRWGIPLAVVAVVVVAVVAFLVLRPEQATSPAEVATKTEQVSTPAKKQQSAGTSNTATRSNTAAKTATSAAATAAASPAPAAKAAAKPAPVNHYEEGMRYLEQGNYDKAIEHLRTAAKANNGEAAFQLGELYMNGTGVAANKEEAIRWYKVAAKAGHKEAKRKLF